MTIPRTGRTCRRRFGGGRQPSSHPHDSRCEGPGGARGLAARRKPRATAGRGWGRSSIGRPGPPPVHFSFVGRRAEAGEARAALLAAEAAAAEREELNLLYVAITRARQVFIASGSQSTRAPETTHTSGWPLR